MRIPLGACVKRGGGEIEEQKREGWEVGWGVWWIDRKRERRKEKKMIPPPPLLSVPLATLMWNGAIPTSAQVVGCRRRGSVASSWSSSRRIRPNKPSLLAWVIIISLSRDIITFLLTLINKTTPSQKVQQTGRTTTSGDPERRCCRFPGASHQTNSGRPFFFFSHLIVN